MSRPTAERARTVLAYDAETGQFSWKLKRGPRRAGSPAGWPETDGRLYLSIDGRSYIGHRVAWLHVTGEWPVGQIDHIDGDPTNNRFANLRDVSAGVNQQNRRKAQISSRSGILGVRKRGATRFEASISINGKPSHLGSFRSADEAQQAYIAAKREHHAGCTI